MDAGGEDGIDDRVFDVANPAAYPIIQNATIRGGHTLGHDGGGIRTLTGSSLKLKDVVIANNHADEPGAYAGGLMAIGDETKLVDVVVKNNEALNVGGLNFDSPGIMRRVTVTGNESAYAGGGVRSVDDLKIYDSTISGNTITSPGGGHGGGGVAFVGGSSVLRNSTISGNSSGQDGGGIAAFGGTLEIVHSTITRNTADFDSDLTLGDGGGIWSDVDIVPTIRSSVIANNVRRLARRALPPRLLGDDRVVRLQPRAKPDRVHHRRGDRPGPRQPAPIRSCAPSPETAGRPRPTP